MPLRLKRLLMIFAPLLLLPILALAILSATARRPSNLGVTAGKLLPCPASPNAVSTQSDSPEHRIEPLTFTGEPAVAWKRLRAALATLPRVNVITERDDYLYAEVTSRLFRFVDDVEFVLDSESKQIHFRSASRVGHSDMGANRARMEAVRTEFERLAADGAT